MQRLLRALRKSAVQRLIVETAAEGYENVAQPPGAVGRLGLCRARPAHSPSSCSSPQRCSVSQRPKAAHLVTFSDEAIRGVPIQRRLTLNHWDGLTRFLDDGRIELDTNIVERGIRPIVLNGKNALFATRPVRFQ